MPQPRPPSLRTYRAALLRYIGRDDERSLARAYELGRAALKSGRGILQLLELHFRAMGPLLESLPRDALIRTRIRACNEFLAEALAPFEMRRL